MTTNNLVPTTLDTHSRRGRKPRRGERGRNYTVYLTPAQRDVLAYIGARVETGGGISAGITYLISKFAKTVAENNNN